MAIYIIGKMVFILKKGLVWLVASLCDVIAPTDGMTSKKLTLRLFPAHYIFST